MKNLQKFAENQLSKAELNQVKGGAIACICDGGTNHGLPAFVVVQNWDSALLHLEIACKTTGTCR